MKIWILILPLFLMAGKCPKEYIEVKPDVPEHLLAPVPISDMRPVTYRDLAELATLHLNSAEQANTQIEAIDCILNKADTEKHCP